ncbi:NAD(P)H-dependent oxidoreductase [Kineosporia mesophila]|uniref:NAD(P)H-dependent oxidoreductase n=1 Tax=Kineosporia mesophila TaxID=566012 RepID=A0ABP6ZE60_9ACTN|nr:FMN reductase [Kineosporia mesophila]MCD5350347.1 FMN reductase [Kineosporia mesophila]
MGTSSVVVISAGLSQPSSTRLLADKLGAAVAAGTDVELTVIELRDLAHHITNHLLTGFPTGELVSAIKAVTEADALIAVTPIFSASYSGLFKSFFDVLELGALEGKPVLIAATGGSSRHSLALEHAVRPLFSYLKAVVVPTAVYAASEDWASAGSTELSGRVGRAARQLTALMAGAGSSSTAGKSVVKDPFADVLPFGEMMRARGL